jgi:hypothetical protein
MSSNPLTTARAYAADLQRELDNLHGVLQALDTLVGLQQEYEKLSGVELPYVCPPNVSSGEEAAAMLQERLDAYNSAVSRLRNEQDTKAAE